MSSTQWIVRVNEQDHPAPDLRTLQTWAHEGRINRDSLIYHPTLARWGYASEFAEIASEVQAPPAKQQRSAARTCLLLALVIGLAGVMNLVSGYGGIVTTLCLVAGVAFFVFAGVLYSMGK